MKLRHAKTLITGKPGSYAGTSIAAAFSANRIAEYLSRNPNAGIQEVFNALRAKTEPYQAVEKQESGRWPV